ncbi:MAG: SGNH/GDSL hydrolase family protein [Candidatus Aminicenantes bacterium]|jgi:lysophospholipase L1-like esterase
MSIFKKKSNSSNSNENSKPSKGRKKKLYILIIVIVIVITIWVVELIFAHMDKKALESQTHVIDWGTRRAIELEEPRPGRIIKIVPWGEHLIHSDGLLEKRVYDYRVDEEGFVIPSKIYQHPDKLIVFLGGSTTQIVMVDPELRFPYLVGRMLENRTGKKINAYNHGKSGAHTLDSINSFLNKIIAHSPNIVILMHNINDLNSLIYNKGTYYGKVRNPVIHVGLKKQRREKSISESGSDFFEAIMHGTIPHIYVRLKNSIQSIFGNNRAAAQDEFQEVRHEERQINEKSIKENFKRNLKLFIYIAKSHHIIPVLMTQANRFFDQEEKWHQYIKEKIEKDMKISFERYCTLYRSLNDLIRQVGNEHDVMVIDLAAGIPQRSEFIHDPVHFNANGSKLAADIITHQLMPLLQ